MQLLRAPNRRPRHSEEGYLLVAVMFLLFLLLLSLSIAAPRIARQLQRDREMETMERGKQYIRAIRLYYRKFSAYPPSIDALVKTSDIRFLRKKYIDPLTGKDDWKPVLFGQNKAPTVMGFFGQPLAGASVAGIGPSGGNGLQGTSGLSGSSTPGSPFSSNFNSPSASPDSSGSLTSSNSAAPGAGTTSTGGANTPDSSTALSSLGSGTSGLSGSTTGSATTSGQTFGGAGMIGVSPIKPGNSLLIYKTKEHYNEWEFVYDPIMEQMMQMSGNTGLNGQPASTTTSPGGTPGSSGPGTSSFGTSSFGSSGSGSSSFGSSSPSPSSAGGTSTFP